MSRVLGRLFPIYEKMLGNNINVIFIDPIMVNGDAACLVIYLVIPTRWDKYQLPRFLNNFYHPLRFATLRLLTMWFTKSSVLGGYNTTFSFPQSVHSMSTIYIYHDVRSKGTSMAEVQNLNLILHQHPFQGCTCNTYIQGVSGCCDLDTAPSDVGSTIHLASHLRNILEFCTQYCTQLLHNVVVPIFQVKYFGETSVASVNSFLQFWRWFCSKCWHVWKGMVLLALRKIIIIDINCTREHPHFWIYVQGNPGLLLPFHLQWLRNVGCLPVFFYVASDNARNVFPHILFTKHFIGKFVGLDSWYSDMSIHRPIGNTIHASFRAWFWTLPERGSCKIGAAVIPRLFVVDVGGVMMMKKKKSAQQKQIIIDFNINRSISY